MKKEIGHIEGEELAIWLALHALHFNGFSNRRMLAIVNEFRHSSYKVNDVWTSTKDDLRAITLDEKEISDFLHKRSLIDPAKLLEQVEKSGLRAIPIADGDYPYRLREIVDPPICLFMRGELEEHDFDHCIGVVGTRSPSAYGTRLAKEMGMTLTREGAVVASGLAIGVDSLAHWGAIAGGGRTLAIVATGPDVVYPSSNKKLCAAILDGHGAIISEYFPGTQPEKWHFPARNRIISGVSKGVVVVEAGEQSGALITARLAFEQNREVFAIPGRIDSPTSIGSNGLIAKHMAQLVTSGEDVMNQLSWVKAKGREVTTVVELYGKEKDIYQIVSNEPKHFDVLCEELGIQPGELSATLTMLELAGLVARHPGDWYTRVDLSTVPGERASLPSM